MSRIVYYVAVSADGFIASRDGRVDWLERFQSPELGYEAFLAGVGAVVLGRATYEQSLTFGPWPYPDRRGLVVSSKPIAELPPEVRVVTAAELPRALEALRSEVRGDVWIVGGGRTARACLAAGLLDEIELYLVPRLLGDGIPVFERHERFVALRCLEARAFENGIVQVRYAVEGREPAHGR
jgi:dihydrofolate reductase